MKVKSFFLVFCLALFPVSPGAEPVAEEFSPTGVASRCMDGDTFQMADRRVIRLSGIDAPELPRNAKKPQYYSRQSRLALEKLIKGKPIKLEFPGLNLKDKYGRVLAEVKLPDGSSVNLALVEAGAAFFYPHPDLGPEFQDKLRLSQAEAIKERRGMWEYVLNSSAAQKNYVGNSENLRFFPADCPDIEGIRPRNRVDFGSLMDAFLAGYAPARICPFWPEEN